MGYIPVELNEVQFLSLQAQIVLPTIAALRGRDGPTNASIAHVIGYHNDSDVMGGGLFQRLAQGPVALPPDDGGMIIVDASGYRWKRIIRSAFNGFEFGAVGDDTADDHAAIQALIDYAYGNSTEGPQKSILIPAGFRFRSTDQINIPGRMSFRSESAFHLDRHSGNSPLFVIGSDDPNGTNSHQNGNFFLQAALDRKGNNILPMAADPNGTHAVEIRTAQFWDIEIRDARQFTGAQLFAKCLKGQLGWVKQHVQHNRIKLGQGGFNGWALAAFSDDGADAHFGGNRIEIINPFANWCDLQIDGLFGVSATSSNTIVVQADDAPATGGTGIRLHGSFNDITCHYKDGFLIWGNEARYNNVRYGNNVQTGAHMNFTNMHHTNTLRAGMPNDGQVPTTFPFAGFGNPVRNVTGIDLEISTLATITPQTNDVNGVQLKVTRVDGSHSYLADMILETQTDRPQIRQKMLKASVPSGWFYEFVRVGTSAAVPIIEPIHAMPRV